MYLNRGWCTLRKWYFFVTSKVWTRIWVENFKKRMWRSPGTALCQHLSRAIFHIENGITHRCCEFYKRERLIHVRVRTKIYTLKRFGTLVEIRIHTWVEDERENVIRKKLKRDEKKNFQTPEMPRGTCDVVVSIYCIFKYFLSFSRFVHRCVFNSCRTPDWKFSFF